MKLRPALLSITLPTLVALGTAHAGDIVKLNNATQLQLTGAWNGGNLPTAGDIAVWNSTLGLTGAGTLSNTLAGALSVEGLRIEDITSDTTIGTVQIAHNTASALTLGSAGISVDGANLTFSGSGGTFTPLTLGANQTWGIASGYTLTLGSNWKTMAGSANLAITGGGTLVLGGGSTAATYAFGTGALTLGGGLRLVSDATDQTNRTRVIANATALTSDITLQLNSDGTTGTGASTFQFTGGLNIGSENRTITLSRPNGATTTQGALTTAVLTINAPGQITGTGALTFANESSNAAKVTSVQFLGSSVGGATVSVPEIIVKNNVWLLVGNGANGTIGSGVALTLEAGGALKKVSTIATATTVKSLAGAGSVTAANSNALTLNIDGGAGTGSTNFSGTISDREDATATAQVHITKSGGTTQIFSGANTYIGVTTVNGGTLLINGTHIQNANGSGYIVNAGGTLGGTGLIARMTTTNTNSVVTVNSGGFLAPGGASGIGTLTLDGQYMTAASNNRHLVMNSGAQFNLTLAGDGSGADSINFWNYATSTDLVLTANALNLSLSGPQVSGEHTVSIFRFFSDNGNSAINGGITTGLVLGMLGEGISDVSISYNSGGSTIDLTYTVTAVPEPSSIAALAGAVALAGVVLRRRPRVG